MWLDEADGLAEIFRGYLPYYVFVFLPIFMIIAPASPVAAAHEFSVYRMHQYDLHTVPHGCRSAAISLEGRSLTSWATSRHCVVARLQEITVDQLIEIRNKAGALLLVLPKNITELTTEQKEHIYLLEQSMLIQEFTIPVYFTHWSPEVDHIIGDLEHSFITDDKSGTALEAMINSVSSNGYQIVVSSSTPQKLESKPVTLHGKLVGKSAVAQNILIIADYDSSSVVPELSFGADSNASGAVALLELARIFSKLYANPSTRGGASITFVLTGVGSTLNYFSAKKWLEDQLDSTDGSTLQDVTFAMCLSSISSSSELTMHVSKPPKPGSPAASIRSRLGVEVHHKKINLADELLAWQHERFSIRRMTAFTLSGLQSYKEALRNSVLDIPTEQSAQNLISNIRNTARALASHIYNLTSEHEADKDSLLYNDALNIDEASVRHWYKYLTSQTRSAHVVTTTTNGVSSMVLSLERALSRYLGEVTSTTHTIDKRDPEYTLYGPTKGTLNVYSVKPAIFDLIITLGIIAYLTLFYFMLQIFPRFYVEFAKIVTGKDKINID